MKAVGFIGLGIMGAPMAVNLLKSGYSVTVYNRTALKAEDLRQFGADVVYTPAEAARSADVLFTMVSDDQALEEVFYGEDGIVSGVKPGLVIFDCSTVSPDTSRRLHKDLAGYYVDFLDSPVTGSLPAAVEGKLVFIVGGKKEIMEEHQDLLLTMGARCLHMGPSGAGSEAKLAMNTIVGINMVGLAEGMAMAAKSGLDLETFADLVIEGGASSRMAMLKAHRLLGREFSPQFSMKLMHKDLKLAERLTASQQLPTPILHAVEEMFRIGVTQGLGEQDLSAIVQLYEQWGAGKMVGGSGTSSAGARVGAGGPGGSGEAGSSGGAGGTGSSSGAADEGGGINRRKEMRIPLDIDLQISVHQWEHEGSFLGQSMAASLHDLSESGMQIICKTALTTDMFVVIHFPSEAGLPPIIGKIIRSERRGDTFHYGCMITGMSPHTRVKLEGYIQRRLETLKGR